MIKLMHVDTNYSIDMSQFSPLLTDPIVEGLENTIADYVGAKYACSIHSASMAIFLSIVNKPKSTISIPAIMPPVVPNAILTAGHDISYYDDINWVGSAYVLHEFDDYKIIDSAQQLDRNQFKNQANDHDLMIFSFYPTKPVGSIDGGMIVSNDEEKIKQLKILSRYGTNLEENSWERKNVLAGWKMYMNSVQAYVAMQNFHKLDAKFTRLDEIRYTYNNAFNLSNTSRHLYRLRVKNRNTFISNMKDKGIQCGIHYRSVHDIECYKSKFDTDLTNTIKESDETVSIPYHEKLTNENITFIIKEVENAIS